MVKLFRPTNVPATTGTAKISVGASTGGEAIGQVQASSGIGLQNQAQQGALAGAVGNIIEQEGTRYFEETKAAHNMSLINNSITEATLEFQKAKQARTQQTTDKHGNPTYRTLVDDIGAIGDDIAKRISGNIQFNPEAINQFNTKFKSFVATQQISALKTARTQQISFGKSSLDKGLGNLVLQGAADELGNLGTYQTQGQDMLNDALSSGIISSEDFSRMSNEFQVILKEAAISDTISTNPAEAQQVLSQSADQLGIPQERKTQLDNTLDAKIRSDKVQTIKAEQKNLIDNNSKVSQVVTDAEQRIEADAMREDDLLRLGSKLPGNSFKALKKKFVAEAKKRAKKTAKLQAVSTGITSGVGAAEFSVGDRDEYYKFQVETNSFNQQRPTTFIEKAMLTSSYKAPVRAFAREMNSTIQSGDTQQALEAISAYTYIQDRKLTSLDGSSFSKETETLANYVETLIDRGGLQPEQALAKARKDVLDVDPNIKKIRSSIFRSIPDFKPSNLEDTAAEELGAEGFFGNNKKVSGPALSTYDQFVREAYTATGDIDGAKATAKALMGKTHGLSTAAGPEEEYVFAPVEKFFPNEDPEDLRDQYIAQALPILPKGTLPEAISIQADNATVGQLRIVKRPDGTIVAEPAVSYLINQTVSLGDGGFITIPVVSPKTGKNMRWVPDIGAAKEQKQAEDLEEAKRQRKTFQEGQGIRANRAAFISGIDIPRED